MKSCWPCQARDNSYSLGVEVKSLLEEQGQDPLKNHQNKIYDLHQQYTSNPSNNREIASQLIEYFARKCNIQNMCTTHVTYHVYNFCNITWQKQEDDNM